MTKPLEQMTNEELWQLFPIFLRPHSDDWAAWYEEETARLAPVWDTPEVRVWHVGSTSIRGIWAKPIVDILVEIPLTCSMEQVKQALLSVGYRCMWEGKERKIFNKGYTEHGFAQKVFHLHLRRRGDNDELYFRDYMNDHPALAKEYEALKLKLWKQYEHDRDGYTDAKTAFVTAHTQAAKREYAGRYA